MKILVIDDNPLHQSSAVQTLGSEHELTVVGDHDEARELLSPYYNKNFSAEVEMVLRDKGLPSKYWEAREIFNPKSDPEGWLSWEKAEKQAERDVYHWDAVLSDLLMPAGARAQGIVGMKYVGTEMPVGWSLAIHAALKGAKYVVVATDTNHHHHPASAMLDCFTSRKPFAIHMAKAIFTNRVEMVHLDGKPEEEEGKDWAELLNRVMEVKK